MMMSEAKTKQSATRRVAQWQKEVLELQARALELVIADREESNDKPASEVALEVVQLAEDGFMLLWPGWNPELVFSSATASLKAGRPVLAVKPVQRIPGMPLGLIDEEAEAPQKLQAGASEVRIVRAADPEPEPEPEPVEALEPEPLEHTPEPEPALPVVITEQQWKAPAEADPPAADPSDGWVGAERLAQLLDISWASVTKGKREGLFDGHWRAPLPGEGRGVRYDVEACREARANRSDLRKRATPKPPKPLRVSADALAADPALMQQLEQMLAAVRAET